MTQCVFEPGDAVEVRTRAPIITDDGLRFHQESREAVFVELAPKPWEPDACYVDYGDGRRKCNLKLLTEGL